MLKITAQPNGARTGFHFPSEYNKATFLDWLKKYDGFEITPIEEDTHKGRGYLYGAVIPCYCEWQYNIDPREQGVSTKREYLFKRDFNYEIEKNRKGIPVRTPMSLKGRVKLATEKYTRYAEENGLPIPNVGLYKLWRDKWSMEVRFHHFKDFLLFLGIEQDSMPSKETLDTLEVPQYEYPTEEANPTF